MLDGTVAEIGQLERVREAAYLRLGEFPVEDPDWEVGIEEMLGQPYYQGLDAVGAEPIAYDDHVMWQYDRIPKGDVEIRRASPVTSADRHHLGHVDGFIVDGQDHIGHLVLEHGHLWGKREVVIPIGAVARVETDAVVLTLSRTRSARSSRIASIAGETRCGRPSIDRRAEAAAPPSTSPGGDVPS